MHRYLAEPTSLARRCRFNRLHPVQLTIPFWDGSNCQSYWVLELTAATQIVLRLDKSVISEQLNRIQFTIGQDACRMRDMVTRRLFPAYLSIRYNERLGVAGT